MNWLPLSILAYLLLAAEPAARGLLRLGSADPGVWPMLAFVLVVHVALVASGQAALWTALIVGAAFDLLFVRVGPATTFALVGPGAVGFVAAAYFVTTLRGMVARNSLFALAAVCVPAAAIAGLVAVVLLEVRSWFDPDMGPFPAGAELWARLGCALYTGVAAFAVGWVIRLLSPLLGLGEGHGRRSGRFG